MPTSYVKAPLQKSAYKKGTFDGTPPSPFSSKDGAANCTPSMLYKRHLYRELEKGLQILLSRTQAGPGRAVKQEQEEISPNHVQAISGASVSETACKGILLLGIS